MISIIFVKDNKYRDKILLLCFIYVNDSTKIIFKEYMDIDKITFITRLYIDYIFGKNKINNIIEKYEILLNNCGKI